MKFVFNETLIKIIIKGIFPFLVICLSSFAQEQNREIKIGYITDLSGNASYWGSQGFVGARLAVKELNDSGKNVKLFAGDSRLNATKGVSELNKMLYHDGVDALLIEFTPVVLASSPIVLSRKKMMLGTTPAESFLKNNPYAFRGYLDYKQGCKRVAEYWKSKGMNEVGILRIDFESGEACELGAREIFPDMTRLSFRSGDDLSSQMLKLKSQNIKAVFLIGFEGDYITANKVADSINYKVALAGADHDFEPKRNPPGKNITELVFFGFSEVSDAFTKKILSFDPKNSETGRESARLVYTHIKQIAFAIENCKKDDVLCQVNVMKNSAPVQELSFKGFNNGNAQYDSPIFTWKQGKRNLIK